MSHRRLPGCSHHPRIQALKPSNTCANRANITRAVCPAITSTVLGFVQQTLIFPLHHSAMVFSGDSVPTWRKTKIKSSQLSQQQQRMPKFLPWFICPEVLWAANYLAMGTDAAFWFIRGGYEISVTQLELIRHSWSLCLFQELVYACRIWPLPLPRCMKSAKKPGTVLGTQDRIHQGAGGLSLENHMLLGISSQLLWVCLGVASVYAFIHPEHDKGEVDMAVW